MRDVKCGTAGRAERKHNRLASDKRTAGQEDRISSGRCPRRWKGRGLRAQSKFKQPRVRVKDSLPKTAKTQNEKSKGCGIQKARPSEKTSNSVGCTENRTFKVIQKRDTLHTKELKNKSRLLAKTHMSQKAMTRCHMWKFILSQPELETPRRLGMCALERGRQNTACKHRQMLLGPRPPRGTPPCIPATRLLCSTRVPQQWHTPSTHWNHEFVTVTKAHQYLGGEYMAV